MNYVAMDIGGSSIKAGVINSAGDVLHKTSRPTPMTCFEDLIQTLSELVEWGKGFCEISGIGLSQPCRTDSWTGEAQSEGALIYIKGTNPAKTIGEKYGLPYAAENDGNCAGLAEVWIGNARGSKNVAVVVCGTGIGGAVLIDGEVVSGKRNFAGEFGMFVTGIDSEGMPVNWSAMGSTYALVRSYAKISGRSVDELDGKRVFQFADSGDKAAENCIDLFFKTFAIGLHNIQHALDPEMILVGGAISSRHDFVSRIDSELDAFYSKQTGFMSRPNISTCACGPDANLIGAVYHLIQNHGG